MIINKCCHNDPDKRFQTVSELKFAWLTAIGAFHSPSVAERVNYIIGELHGDATSNRDASLNELCDILMTKPDDADFIHTTIMKVPANALAELAALRFDDFSMVLRVFCDVTSRQRYGFSYTDRIGEKCVSLYLLITDYDMRADLLYCLFEVGHGHNRFYLMNLFENLIREPCPPGEGFAIVEKLKEANPRYLARVSKRVTFPGLDKSLYAFFEEHAE